MKVTGNSSAPESMFSAQQVMSALYKCCFQETHILHIPEGLYRTGHTLKQATSCLEASLELRVT